MLDVFRNSLGSFCHREGVSGRFDRGLTRFRLVLRAFSIRSDQLKTAATGAMKKKSTAHPLIRKIRKPIAPPSKVEEDLKRYRRARERDKARREELENSEKGRH